MKIPFVVIGSHLLVIATLLYLQSTTPKTTPRRPVAVTTQTLLLEPPPKPQQPTLQIDPPPPPSELVIEPVVIPKPIVEPVATPQPIKTIDPPKPPATPPTTPLPKPVVKPVVKPLPKASPAPTPKPSVKKDLPKNTTQQEKLIAMAKQSLATLNSSKPSSSQPSASQLPKKNAIGPLASEMLSFETRYEEELVTYLEALLSLPEKGEVKLRLSLKREGSVQKIDILNASNVHNRAYIEGAIATFSFPPFGSHFKGEATHTFTITLKTD